MWNPVSVAINVSILSEHFIEFEFEKGAPQANILFFCLLHQVLAFGEIHSSIHPSIGLPSGACCWVLKVSWQRAWHSTSFSFFFWGKKEELLRQILINLFDQLPAGSELEMETKTFPNYFAINFQFVCLAAIFFNRQMLTE